jgi:prepilin-type N-terminal cleavage/methylation domain-containing protein
MSAPRGVTLLETMVAVAVIGIMSSMAGLEVINTLRISRITNAAKSLESVLKGARLRSIVSNCTHVVQVNGTLYNGTGPTGFSGRRGAAIIVRKGVCASVNAWFEAGDVRVDEVDIEGLSLGVEMGVPVTLITDGVLDTESIAVGYDRTGSRLIGLDSTGVGSAGFATVGSAPDSLLLPRRPGATATVGLAFRPISVPQNANPVMLK